MRALLVNKETKTVTEINSGSPNKILFFGVDDFIENIVKADSCFMCGAAANSKVFNNEHVIPNWVLRKYNLHNESITLPNGTIIKYGSYTVPCCQECNTELGEKIESPISKLLTMPFKDIVSRLEADKSLYKLIFHWMNLIFLKTHLKDTNLLAERDRRINAGKIGDYYDWSTIHHIHCMSRSDFTHAEIEESLYGSLILLPSFTTPNFIKFDYMDSLEGKLAMFKLDTITIYAVLNDSGIVTNMCEPMLKSITGPVSSLQTIDLFARLNHLNQNLTARPKYTSSFTDYQHYVISAEIPEKVNIKPREEQSVALGEFFHFYFDPILPSELENRTQIMEDLRAEKRNYLFDENGKFIQHDIPSAD